MLPLPILRAAAVSRRYRRGTQEVAALEEVSFTVDPGTVVAIIGPSGSGKSTLLNILAGLDKPSTGDVFIDDTRLADLDVDQATVFRRRRIGFVFQFFNLLPTMTARRNVALPLVADRCPRAEIPDRVAEALAAVGMTHRAEHRPDELSGGEQQRIAIARALVMRPALVLADEPTGNLDSATGGEILRLLRARATAGVALVMVTHSDTAAAAADRVLEIRDGRLANDRSHVPVGG